MKKMLAVLAGLLIGSAVMAALDATLLQNAVMLAPQEQAEAGVLNGAAVDKMPFTGVGAIVISVGTPGTNEGFSVTFQVQHAPNSTGTFVNVTGKTATRTTAGVSVIPYDFTSGDRYLRLVATTTNDVAPIAATINSYK